MDSPERPRGSTRKTESRQSRQRFWRTLGSEPRRLSCRCGRPREIDPGDERAAWGNLATRNPLLRFLPWVPGDLRGDFCVALRARLVDGRLPSLVLNRAQHLE